MARNIHSNQVIHKHYHFHYYPEEDKNPFQNPEKSLVNTSITPKKTQRYHPYSNDNIYMENDPTNSWKKHINPEITKMYEEISINQSFNDHFSGSNSYAFDRGNYDISNYAYKPNIRITKKQALKQEIEKYEEYLKMRSKVNLYVPGTRSMINLRNFTSQNRQEDYQKNQSQIQKMYRKKQFAQKQDVTNPIQSQVRKSKEQFSTFLSGQISAIKTLKQQEEGQKQILIKTIKNQKKKSQKQSIYNDMKQTVDSKIVKSAQNLQSNISKITKPSDFLFESFNKKDFQKQASEKIVQEHDKLYRFRLLEEECIYLRNNFISHIEQKHSKKKDRKKKIKQQKI